MASSERELLARIAKKVSESDQAVSFTPNMDIIDDGEALEALKVVSSTRRDFWLTDEYIENLIQSACGRRQNRIRI